MEHYAPRIVLNREANPLRHQQAMLSAGWLMGETPDTDKFLAMEPADEALNQQAARRRSSNLMPCSISCATIGIWSFRCNLCGMKAGSSSGWAPPRRPLSSPPDCDLLGI